jgi:hypothetical protein
MNTREEDPMKRMTILWVLGAVLVGVSGAKAEEQRSSGSKGKQPKEVKLFDGKTLKGWRILDKIDFDDHGKVEVKDGELLIGKGNAMTGISWKGEFPRINYEVSLEGRRIEGDDFFCGMTFPVGKTHCSLILGGWGGSLTGLSCIDGYSADENETTGVMDFERNRWYKIRLRVTKEKIEAWVDKEKIVDVETKDRKIDLRWEMETMPPFGFATYYTTGGLKHIVVKRL